MSRILLSLILVLAITTGLSANPWDNESPRNTRLAEMTGEQREFYTAVVKRFAPVILQDFRVIEVSYQDENGETKTAKILDPADAPTAHDFDGDWDLSNNHAAYFQTDENGNMTSPITLKDVQDIQENGWVRVPALLDGVIVQETPTQVYFSVPLYHIADTATFLSFVKEHSQDGGSVWMVLDKSETYREEGSVDEKLGNLEWAYALTDPHGLARPVSPNAQMEQRLRETIQANYKPKDLRNLQGAFLTLDRSARAHHESENDDRFIRDEDTGEAISFHLFSARQSHALFQADPEIFRGREHLGYVYVCDGEWDGESELPHTYCSVVDSETGEISYPDESKRIAPIPFRFRADVLAQAFPITPEQFAGESIDASMAYTGQLVAASSQKEFMEGDTKYVIRKDLPAHFTPAMGESKAKANLPENLFPTRAYAENPLQVSAFHLVDRWLRPEMAESGAISGDYYHNPFLQVVEGRVHLKSTPVNVRTGPSAESSLAGQLADPKELVYLLQAEPIDGFYLVHTGSGVTGFILEDLVE